MLYPELCEVYTVYSLYIEKLRNIRVLINESSREPYNISELFENI